MMDLVRTVLVSRYGLDSALMGDEGFQPSGAFLDASLFASTSPQMSKVSNDVKLKLYALYKVVTVSRNPQSSRPSIFDMTGRAKWDAWATESKASNASNESLEDVQNRYLALCSKYGWTEKAQGEDEQSTPVAGTSNVKEEESIEDIDWDAPYDPTKDDHRHSGKAMGNSVSVLQKENTVESITIHGLTVTGDAGKLKTLLDLDKALNIDEKDEYGYTALQLAADRGHTSIVNLLLERGADASILDPDGFSAMELAEASGKEEVVMILKQRQ